MQPMFWYLMGGVCLVGTVMFFLALFWVVREISSCCDERLGLQEWQKRGKL